MMAAVVLLHAISTLGMFGVIWFVQVVHYPLFGKVGVDQFNSYEHSHQQRTTVVVMPLMLIEAFTSLTLVFYRPPGVPFAAAVAGLILVILIWASTFFWQVPKHGKLSRGFDAATHRQLVLSNWLRTFAWSLRAGLVCWMLYVLLPN